jgi:hypothetical protein
VEQNGHHKNQADSDKSKFFHKNTLQVQKHSINTSSMP